MTDLQSRIAALSPEKRELLERRLADRVAGRRSAMDERIKPRDRSRPIPLAFQQEREWAMAQFRPANNIPGIFRVEGQLDLALLSRVLTEVTERHEVLRSTVELREDGTRVQVVYPVTPVPTPVVDLSDCPAGEQRAEILRRFEAEVVRPFDPQQQQRIRICVLRLAQDSNVVIIITDHAAADLVSVAILVQEFAALYAIHLTGANQKLPPMEIQYGDFAAWQRDSGEKLMAAEVEHWRQTLDGIPGALTLPSDRPFPARPTFAGAAHSVDLPSGLSEEIRRFSEREKASLGVVLLAAISVLLYRYLGQDDLVIGELVSGRSRVEVERLIGCFVTALPLRMRLADDQTLREVVAQARNTVLTAYDHQDLPIDRLIDQLGLGHEASQTSMSHMWIDVRTPESTLEVPGLRISPEPIDVSVAAAPLTLDANPVAGTLRLQWIYMTEMFDAETVVLLADQFDHVVRQLVTEPDLEVGQVQLAATPAATAPRGAERPGQEQSSVVELFQRRVALAPHAAAVICDGAETSYAALNRDANRLAHHLRALGVGPETPVGILAGRSPWLAVAILGVLKAGGGYVPLDPGYPPERISFMLADAGARILVTERPLAASFAGAGGDLPDEVVFLDSPSLPAGAEAEQDPEKAPDPTSLAYIVYTSGSTGRPKGAMIEHQSLVTFARDVADRFGLSAGDRFLQFASPSFDVLAEELFPTWLAGGAVVMTTQHIISGEVDLGELAEREQLTVMELPTAYWHEWVRELDRQRRLLPRSLRLVIIGGERVLPERLVMWRRLEVPLMHVYGLTETTVSSTFFRLDPADPVRDWPNLPIGTPLPSAGLCVLDRQFRPVPVGGTGELYIGGISLARGYLGRAGLTAHRFIADPDPARPGQRLYRTGDVVRQRPDGNFEFVSRADRQIKIRGFRVEPTEIESALSRHPQVAESIVVLLEPAPGDRRLVAYVVSRAGASLGAGDLRPYLEGQLPAYMVPSAFVQLDALPLTANGKIDHDRLPAPDGDRPELAEEYVAPQTPTQRKLADLVAAVTGVARVGIHDNFFDLGGDSIQAIQVVARAQEEGIGLTPLDFFEHPTVALLAQAATNPDEERAVNVRPADAPPLLSFDQERLWLENQLRPKTSYHVGGRVRLVGELNVPALEAGIRTILARHEVLRARFPTVDGQPIQVVDDLGDDWHLPVMDLAGANGDGADIARRLMDEQFSTPFDLADGPLFRCLLVRLSATEHHLAVTTHHIVSDLWSINLFAQELSALYQAGGDADRAHLPALPIQYRDYAVWQRSYLPGGTLQTHLDHWRRHLAGAPAALALPTAERRPGAGGDRVLGSLPKEDTARLYDLCRRHGVTLFMTVLASLGTVLGRWSGQPDVVVGVSMSDRTDTRTERLIGFFIKTLPLRVNLSGNPTFAELLRRVRQISLDGYAHADAPLDVLVRELQAARDPRRTPLFQVVLNVADAPTVDQIGDLALEVMESPQLFSSFDLICTAQTYHGELLLRLEYNAELYQPAMMQALMEHLQAFIRAVASDPSRGLLDYALQPADTAEDTVPEPGNSRQPAYAAHLAVDRQARGPGRPAVIDADGEWSYQWLSLKADQVAQFLLARPAPTSDHVGVIRRPTARFVAAVLGCMKAGAAFSVLEPDDPQPAGLPPVAAILDVQPGGQVTDGVLDLSVLCPDRGGGAPGPDQDAAAEPGPGRDDWAVERFRLTSADRFAVLSGSPGHLVSAMSSAFCAGGALVLPDRPLAGDVRALTGWLRAMAISVVYAHPPVVRALARQVGAPGLPALRHVFVDNGGELISRDIDMVRSFAPGSQCAGLYRVGSDGRPLAVYAVPGDFELRTAPLRVPLGTGLPDRPARLRHPGGQPAAIGEVAEIWFGSYRTGDLGRRWADGTLEFVASAEAGSNPRKGRTR